MDPGLEEIQRSGRLNLMVLGDAICNGELGADDTSIEVVLSISSLPSQHSLEKFSRNFTCINWQAIKALPESEHKKVLAANAATVSFSPSLHFSSSFI